MEYVLGAMDKSGLAYGIKIKGCVVENGRSLKENTNRGRT